VVTISSLVNLIAKLQGVSTPRISLPLALGKTAGIGVQSAFKLMNKRPPFSRRSLDFFIKDNAYDTKKAQQELNFEAQTNLKEGLMKTIEWLSERSSALALQ
jgi:nucleoside-diphosphate-sugar epimerase